MWLAANDLEPKLSPFDPLAVLDEIERLVPGYKLDRLNLFGGNDVPTEPGFVPVSALTGTHEDLVLRRTTDCSHRERWDGIARRCLKDCGAVTETAGLHLRQWQACGRSD